MNLNTLAKRIFDISSTKGNVICPPDLVFSSTNLVYLITIGGHLVDGKEEFDRLIELLDDIDEKGFFLLENLGATITDRTTPSEVYVPISSNFGEFSYLADTLDYSSGIRTNYFYVFGHNPNWGIYSCEYAAINIIGCTIELRDRFAQVFSVKGNGYSEVKEFISQEWKNHRHLQHLLEINYSLAY